MLASALLDAKKAENQKSPLKMRVGIAACLQGTLNYRYHDRSLHRCALLLDHEPIKFAPICGDLPKSKLALADIANSERVNVIDKLAGIRR